MSFDIGILTTDDPRGDGNYLRGTGPNSLPHWSTLTLPNVAAQGDVLVATAPNAMGRLADVATGNVLLSGGVGVMPNWGKVDLAAHLTGILPAANGGTGIASYAVGDLLYASGAAALSKLAAVAVGQVLVSAGVTTAPAWSASPTLTSLTLAANPATTGTIRLAHGAIVAGRDSTNAVDRVLIDWGAGTTDKLLVGHVSHRLQLMASDIEWHKPLVALGAGAAATLGTIGGSGPTVAGQNSWMRVIDSDLQAFWVPTWK